MQFWSNYKIFIHKNVSENIVCEMAAFCLHGDKLMTMSLLHEHSIESPSMVDPSGIYGIEGASEICTQSAEIRLAVSWAQPLFTLGLLMFALSLVEFLSLPLSPSTNIKIFYFCQKYHLKDTYKILKNFMLA